MNLTFLVGLVV